MSEEVKDNTIQAVFKEQTSNYRSIFKATSLFGGVKVYQILVGIVKSKILAVLLGPTGVGIQGLFQSATTLIQSITAMGIGSSAVRDVSESYASGNQERVNRVVAVVRRLVWGTGLLGMLAVILFSPQLSKSTFGSLEYVVPFVFLSSTLLFDQLAVGHRVVLQGTRRLKALAMSSAVGSTVGLIISIPLYYRFGVKGIVPTLILTSFSLLLVMWYYAKKIPIQKIIITNREALTEGRLLLKMGFSMSVSSILAYAADYVLRWFIRTQSGIDEVGLYNAGFMLMSSYTGMVFTAMTADYYPRLAAVNKDNEKCNTIINNQAEVAVLILAPLLAGLIVFMPFVVRLLYSSEFLPATGYMLWAAIGMMFKALSWSVAFNFIAKGEARLFLYNEVSANIYFLVFNLIGYKLGGLNGLGIAFAIASGVYCLQVILFSYKRYHLRLTTAFTRTYGIHGIMLVACLLLVLFKLSGWAFYTLGILLVIFSLVYSFRVLDERMGIKHILKGFINKKK